MTKTLTIRKPDDFHVHLRQGELLKKLTPLTSAHFARALVMPNTSPPVLTVDDVVRYRQQIKNVAVPEWFEPLMTAKLTHATTAHDVLRLRECGVIAMKLYPEGVTTNSENGIKDVADLEPVFEAMEICGLVLCIHGEMPGVYVMGRERAYLKTLQAIARRHPKLRIVLEHVSTSDAVHAVLELPETVAATITVHHLLLTLDDVVGGMLRPHHFCKPVAKSPKDREMLWRMAISGQRKFFLGTDSAPHPKELKECADGCAGVFTAPVALACLAELFEKDDLLNRLESFCSRYGAEFYGLPLNNEQITLVREPWKVPDMYGPIVPFKAGETLQWRVQE